MIEQYLNQVTCGDCLDLMANLPDGCIDMTITSPPYDNLRTYKGYNFDFEPIARELFRITKQGGVVVWVVADATIKGSETGTSFKQALYFKEIGFNLHDTMIYLKDSPPHTNNRYEPSFEFMFVFSKDVPDTFNPIRSQKLYKDNRLYKKYLRNSDGKFNQGTPKNSDTKIIGNVWYYDGGKYLTTRDEIAFKHPAIFPDQLASDHITTWSNPNDVVFDPMVGSGTSVVVARKLGRKYIGFEISSEYCAIAEERLKQEVLAL